MTRIHQIYFVLLLSSLLVSCASSPKKTTVQNIKLLKMSEAARVQRERTELKRINALIQTERKISKEPVEFSRVLVTPNRSEELLYSDIIRHYQAKDLNSLAEFVKEFVKRFPKSVYADNALFLAGQLHVAMGFAPEGLRYFEKIITSYPNGNKVPGALFGKSIAYRHMKLFSYAKAALGQVKRDFPGSPEAYRVELEEKLLNVEEQSRTE